MGRCQLRRQQIEGTGLPTVATLASGIPQSDRFQVTLCDDCDSFRSVVRRMQVRRPGKLVIRSARLAVADKHQTQRQPGGDDRTSGHEDWTSFFQESPSTWQTSGRKIIPRIGKSVIRSFLRTDGTAAGRTELSPRLGRRGRNIKELPAKAPRKRDLEGPKHRNPRPKPRASGGDSSVPTLSPTGIGAANWLAPRFPGSVQ